MSDNEQKTISTIAEVRALSPWAIVAAKAEGRLDLAAVVEDQKAERQAAAARTAAIRDRVLTHGEDYQTAAKAVDNPTPPAA